VKFAATRDLTVNSVKCYFYYVVLVPVILLYYSSCKFNFKLIESM